MIAQPCDKVQATLSAVADALDALSDAKLEAARALDRTVTGDKYDSHAHTLATGEFSGVCSAYTLVMRMLTDHRRADLA
ncbi:MAG: hypothetical protein QG597_1895 [Actinomycetota bacterium]|nr:hypothetical protein [Actinomycetota bacterium]